MIEDQVVEVEGEFHAVLDRAMGLDLGSVSDDGLRGWLCGMQGLRARVEALACKAARVVEQRGVPGTEGLVSAASVAARHGNADPRVVGADRRVGWWLARFEVLEAAFESGVLTRAHVAVLRSVDDPRTSAAMVEWQRWLVQQAEVLSFSEFCRVVRYWVLAADPDGAEPAVQVRRRGVWWRRDGDGMVRGSFLLDPLAGGVVTSALGAECERLRRAESDDPASERTVSQRRADALVGLVAAGGARAGTGAAVASVHVVMSQSVAEDVLARSAHDHDLAHFLVDAGGAQPAGLDRSRLPLDHAAVDGRCELLDGTPLHPRLAMAAVMRGVLRRVVLDGEGEILDLGRSVRCFPRHLRDVLAVRARGRCEVPDCDAPMAWLQADHLVPWARGGPTAVANGRVACQAHNHRKADQLLPPPQAPPRAPRPPQRE